jgi:hypothetical protein
MTVFMDGSEAKAPEAFGEFDIVGSALIPI